MPAIPSTGDVIDGRYRLDKELGRGGMSVVYRATQLALDRAVAVKMLLPEGTWDQTQLALFDREAKWARSLRHPHIIDILDYGQTTSGLPYMVLELLEGQAVKKALKGGPRDDAWVGRFAVQALKALMAAHAQGVIHRDIKPSNLYLCAFAGDPEFVKVIDFGIAAAVQAASRDPLVPEGTIVGTPLYIAPEQAMGEGVGPATDLYALGLVLAEALAGRTVFPSDLGAYEILKLQLSRSPPPIEGAVLRGPWGEVIERATRKDPTERTATAAEMLEAVNAVIESDFEAPGARLSAYVPPPRPVEVRARRPGDVLSGRFRLDEALGDRLLASVFRGTHLGAGLPVAIKILDPYYVRDAGRKARFLSEVAVMGGLRSPHSLRLQDLGETDDGLPYLVVPWLDGVPFGEVIARGPLDPSAVRDVGLAALESLEDAHAAGVIHGNLKPSNVFAIPRRGCGLFVVVTDYALTRQFGPRAADDVADEDGEVLGSPRYMAPEQLLFRPVGPPTDLFALGLILTEALAGDRVYPDDMPPLAVARRAASAAPVPLPDAVLAGPLGPVIYTATQKDPARRFPDCAAMRAALRSAR